MPLPSIRPGTEGYEPAGYDVTSSRPFDAHMLELLDSLTFDQAESCGISLCGAWTEKTADNVHTRTYMKRKTNEAR